MDDRDPGLIEEDVILDPVMLDLPPSIPDFTPEEPKKLGDERFYAKRVKVRPYTVYRNGQRIRMTEELKGEKIQKHLRPCRRQIMEATVKPKSKPLVSNGSGPVLKPYLDPNEKRDQKILLSIGGWEPELDFMGAIGKTQGIVPNASTSFKTLDYTPDIVKEIWKDEEALEKAFPYNPWRDYGGEA